MAHEVGGTDLAHRLEALAEDRRQDAHGRKDARAKQAGVRFARRFVLVVPSAWPWPGASSATGGAPTPAPPGSVVSGCAGHGRRMLDLGRPLLRLPQAGRVFRAPLEATEAPGVVWGLEAVERRPAATGSLAAEVAVR